MGESAMARVFVAVLAFLAFIFTAGCIGTGDYETDLSHGYKIVRSMSESVALCDSSNLEIVAPHIDGYAVNAEFIIGHVKKSKYPCDDSVPGYFIVDLETGNVKQGLSKEDWLSKLKKYGIKSAPTLKVPPP